MGKQRAKGDKMIGIVDYGLGNIHSVVNALNFLGIKSNLESKPENLKNYEKLILPGVGAFGDAMERLKNSGLDEAVCEFASNGKYLLGVCLGLHLLFERGFEFGEHAGLGLLKGEVIRFNQTRFKSPLKVPHMGWNTCEFSRQSTLNKGLKDSEYFYFVHSYHVCCDDEITLARTFYGYDFTSAVAFNNIFGMQPHPEKSHDVGLKMLKNFVEM